MKNKQVNSTRMPVYRDAGFELFDADNTSGAFEKEAGHEHDPGNYIYSRYRNPTVIEAEEQLMNIEGSRWSLLTQSGMSAIDTALSVYQLSGDERPWLVFSEIYGGTISFIESVLKKRRGIDVQSFCPDNMEYSIDKLEETIKTIKPSLVFFEVISNPLLIVPQIDKIIRIIKDNGAAAIIDNTFATSYLVKPLEMGADIVLHSATKYLGGHGNITAGAICGNDEKLMKDLIEYRKLTGHMLSPDDAYRLNTQMQSFKLRFARQCENAMQLAGTLEESEIIDKVYYPGLKHHGTHVNAKKLFNDKGYGAIVTFSFGGSNEDEKRSRRDRFISKVSGHIKLVPTLGDSHTILMPVESVWGDRYPDPGMIRLSLGFEETSELKAIISEALSDTA